jgi:hypothetical protein
MAENLSGDIYGQIDSNPVIDSKDHPFWVPGISWNKHEKTLLQQERERNVLIKADIEKEKKEHESTNKFFSVPVFWKD